MIELRNIHKRFGTLEVLKGINLTVGEAELVSIVGSSGAGKTTLLQIMGTLDAPSEGDVFIDGERVNSFSERRLAHLRNTKIGFVFQFHQLLPEFSALENVMIPSLVSGADRKASEKRAGELLELMGLSERMSHRPTVPLWCLPTNRQAASTLTIRRSYTACLPVSGTNCTRPLSLSLTMRCSRVRQIMSSGFPTAE